MRDQLAALCDATLPSLSTSHPALALPAYARGALTPGIAHIGVGNFHRVHQAAYIDRCLHLPGHAGWAISGIGLGDGAAAAIPLFGLASLAGIITATLIAGPMSDRIGRRKIFVFVSSVLVGLALIIPMVMPTFTGWLLFTVISGLGFGAFQAVDQALMSEVLPSADSFAKDLGVVNIAATLPQTLAPGLASIVILTFGGYIALFPIGIALSILGAFAVWFIKGVR